MSAFLLAALTMVLVYAPGQNYWVRTWLFPWAELLMTAAVAFAARIKPLSLALVVGYMLISGIVDFAVPGKLVNLSMVSNPAYAILAVIAIGYLSLTSSEFFMRATFVGFWLLIVCGIFYKAAIGAHITQRGVFIGNPSMTGCLIACLMPFYLSRSYDAFDSFMNYVMLLLTVITLYFLEASVPWLVLSAVIGGYIFQRCKQLRLWFLGAVVIVAATILFAHDNLRKIEFFNDSNRFKIWAIGFKYWLDAPWWQQLFGFGFGTTQTLLPKWIMPANDIWTWYHNDFFQAFIELGVAGIGLLGYLMVDLFKAAWRRRDVYFPVLCGVVTWGMFNYPCHMPITALVCGWVALTILKPSLRKV